MADVRERPDTLAWTKSKRLRRRTHRNECVWRHAAAKCGPSLQLHSLTEEEVGTAAEGVGHEHCCAARGDRDDENHFAQAPAVNDVGSLMVSGRGSLGAAAVVHG